MHEHTLRRVLLIRSIDEGDAAGEVLSLSERQEATQAAAHQVGTAKLGLAGPALPSSAERLLVRRAELLLGKLQTRAPVVSQVLALEGGASWLGAVVLAIAFAFGVAMSALDGSHRIDILAFPLLSLIAWNFVVYLIVLVSSLRPHTKGSASPSILSSSYARWIRSRADALLRRSSHFNAPLAEVLQRFASEWSSIARPQLLLRAQRLFHLGAALLAAGLIAGLYVRGLVLRYDAGWDSTFLDADAVRMLIGVVYGPAAAISGIVLPSAAELPALRWGAAASGAPAAPYIHLIALTATLYIVLPRLLLVMLTTGSLWKRRRHPELPAAFMSYARGLLRESGQTVGLAASVVTYAYSPSREALAGLGSLLSEALGGEVKVEVRESVAYGEEDAFVQKLRAHPLPSADCHILVMSLAATPESENHGAMIEAMQRALSRSRASFLLVVDESSYAARMNAEASLATRVAQRSRAWRDFAAARNQTICVVDLNRVRTGAESDSEARKSVREALQRTASA
jgi:hypothetical protein